MYALHHFAHARTRSAEVSDGPGHMGPPHDLQSLSAHVSLEHHVAQPGLALELVCSHFGLLQLAHSFTVQ